MAIHPELPGISITLHSSTTQLIEHNPPPETITNKDLNITTTYVESTAGLTFEFHLKVEKPYQHDCPLLSFHFVINGQDDGVGQLCGRTREYLDRNGKWECVVPGWEVVDENGMTNLHRFVFTSLKIDDQLDFHSDTVSHLTRSELHDLQQKIGTIDVEIYRVRYKPNAKPQTSRKRRGRSVRYPEMEMGRQWWKVGKQITAASEEGFKKLTSGKAISLGVDLQETALEEAQLHCKIDPLNGWNNPLAIFRFLYRSKEDLKRELIIHRTPSPSPLHSPVETASQNPQTFSDISEDEIQCLAEIAHLQNEYHKKQAARRGGIQHIKTPFESLSPERVRELARAQFEDSNNKNGWLKREGGLKKEHLNIKSEFQSLSNQRQTSLPPRNRHQALRETQRDGRTYIELSDDDDAEDDGEPEVLKTRVKKRKLITRGEMERARERETPMDIALRALRARLQRSAMRR